MAIVTFTTDLGTRDFYLAALKGTIIAHAGSVRLVDISHQIKLFDIKEAAFTIRNAYRYFPPGSIHLVHVNSTDANSKLLLGLKDGHYFLTFDTGLLSLAFDETQMVIYQVNEELLYQNSLLFESGIAKVIELLEKEFTPSDFGHLTTDTLHLKLLQPICQPGSIRGTIVYFDHFGNGITNISKKMFADFIGEKSFTVFANVGNTKQISQQYSDVEEGDMVCLFNSTGYLEVAMNKAKAELLMGLKIDMPVMIFAD